MIIPSQPAILDRLLSDTNHLSEWIMSSAGLKIVLVRCNIHLLIYVCALLPVLKKGYIAECGVRCLLAVSSSLIMWLSSKIANVKRRQICRRCSLDTFYDNMQSRSIFLNTTSKPHVGAAPTTTMFIADVFESR